jgi:hypothetical protein
MAQTITFRGSSIRYFDVRQGKEGGDVFCRIHMSASWSEQVRDSMEWEPIPDSVTECKLAGELLASHMILTPGDKHLKQYELQVDISSVEDFRLVCLKDDEGEIRGRELRFVIRTPKEAEGFLGNYVRRVGRHEGALKLAYVVQEKLPFKETKPETKAAKSEAKPAASETEAEEPDTKCVSCNNDLPFEDAAKTMHANGMKCTRAAGASTLASAREAAGGTHARKRKDTGVDAAAVN